MKPKKTLSVQLDQSELERLRQLAKAENRTVSSYLRNVLIQTNILPGCISTQKAGRKSRRLPLAA